MYSLFVIRDSLSTILEVEFFSVVVQIYVYRSETFDAHHYGVLRQTLYVCLNL